MAEKNASGEPPSSYWLSQGVEFLFEEIARHPDAGEPHFDILIVGSGYGGSIAAAEFAGATEKKTGRSISVCVLERGIEHLPGMFPTRMSDLPGHIRFSTPVGSRPNGKREGLFDVRLGDDIHAVVANGLGGGSLINAGVLMPPHESVMREAVWPVPIRWEAAFGSSTFGSFSDLWDEVKDSLGAAPVRGQRAPDTILGWHYGNGNRRGQPQKYEAMRLLAEGAEARPVSPAEGFKATPISVAMANGTSAAGNVELSACIGCGDCATGCNFGAKISHDVNLLVRAKQQGARIFTGATVLRIKPCDQRGWIVETNYTDELLRKREGGPVAITARRVVLAAGTFGSTEILLRSRSDRFEPSDQLGRRFSGNGDIFAAIWKAGSEINSVADETTDPSNRDIGPTITSIIDRRAGDPERDYIVQEISVPGPLRDVFAELFTTTQATYDLVECDRSQHTSQNRPEPSDPLAVDPRAIVTSTAIAVIGRDEADGRMALTDGEDPDAGDGAIRVVWPQARCDRRLRTLLEAVERERGWRALGGRLLPNPGWQFLPRKLLKYLGDHPGPVITVHPLGGCAMGEDLGSGVVDHLGRVFRDAGNARSREVHEGLVVLDGSIVPTSLGINPSLTIATLATRAVRQLMTLWFDPAPTSPRIPTVRRPPYRQMRAPQPRGETSVEFVERLSGELELDIGAGREAYQVELTLRSRPVELVPWLGDINRTLDVDPSFGRLRIFPRDVWRRSDEMPDSAAVVIASVSGTLQVLSREASGPWTRVLRSVWPWYANRGARDSFQAVCQAFTNARPFLAEDRPLLAKVQQFFVSMWRFLVGEWEVIKKALLVLASLTRAGERRSFSYRLRIETVHKPPAPAKAACRLRDGDEIEGYKRLTYSRRACRLGRKLAYARPFNPWWQMATTQVLRFPCWKPARTGGELKLDLPYLARVGIPIARIVKQHNQVDALADLVKLVTYFTRLLVHVHALTFREPDPVRARNVDRLPGVIKGMPPPTIECLRMPPPRPGLQVQLRLTRYPAACRGACPVLLIHGYSASGTTFAHPSVRGGLAKYLHRAGHDVWIVDLRTSPGMATATMGWAFEDAAYADIPLAVDHILQRTGAAKLDIVSHCMGAAMTWMGLLGPGPEPPARDWYRHERESLPLRIRNLVASQVGPVNIFSPDNTMRAYVMRYVKALAPVQDYQFRVEGDPSPLDRYLDRLLASLPYPEADFDRENPFPWFWKKTPWVSVRHRIDALYARVFELGNVSDAVLDAIDDYFGPLSTETVSQVINFALYRVLTDRHGENRFVTDQRIRDRLRFPILTIHGDQNGLVDVETDDLIREVLTSAKPDIDLTSYIVAGVGHQDCLIGSRREEVFQKIAEFLK